MATTRPFGLASAPLGGAAGCCLPQKIAGWFFSRINYLDATPLPLLKGEGIERTTGAITDITGERRLNLIFDTQVRQAHDYGYAKQGWDPDVLDAFPAWRFIRVQPVEQPRDWHTQFEGEVRLKSDIAFWTRVNQDFSLPFGPWGWGCGHDVEDVSREEAEELGLIAPGAPVASPEAAFNQHLEASTRNLDPEIQEYLRKGLGDKVQFSEGTAQWRKT
jgi:hypothetical protein